jgi:hypothetical protein
LNAETMNRLELKIISAGQAEEVRLLVDGVDLFERVRGVERAHAEREGHPRLAGAYAALPAAAVLPPSRHLWGEDALLGCRDGTVALGICDCGEPGCWPLLARVTVDEARVTWSEFRQPHRGPSARAGHWTYESFGPFVFERDAYQHALTHPTRAT